MTSQIRPYDSSTPSFFPKSVDVKEKEFSKAITFFSLGIIVAATALSSIVAAVVSEDPSFFYAVALIGFCGSVIFFFIAIHHVQNMEKTS